MPDFLDISDHLSRSTILRNVSNHRVAFDPANPVHCKSLKKFLETGNWGTVMFYPEYPYTDVPTYVMAKFACHHLKAKRKTRAEQAMDTAREAAAMSKSKKEKVHLVEVPEERVA